LAAVEAELDEPEEPEPLLAASAVFDGVEVDSEVFDSPLEELDPDDFEPEPERLSVL
jgi:hypothetical protein